MEAYLGLIFPFAGSFAPQGTVQCWGQDLPQAQNQALFAIIGTMYGGTSPNFKMPDLRGRVIMGSGVSPYLGNVNVAVASSGGTAASTLNLTNLPQHTHNATFTPGGGSSTSSINATVSIPVGSATNGSATPAAGSNNWLGGVAVEDPNGGNFNTTGPYLSANPGTGSTLTGTATGTVTVSGAGGTVNVSPGGGQATPMPFSNVQPYLAVTMYIVTMGLYPTRD